MSDFTKTEWQKMMNFIFAINSTHNLTVFRKTVLEHLSLLISHKRSFSDLCRLYQSRRIYFDPVGLNMPDNRLKDYYANFYSLDYSNWLLNQHVKSTAYRDSDYFTDNLKQHSLFYQQWLSPMGVYFSCGINIIENEVPYGTITLFRSFDEGDFNDKEMSILNSLVPYIAQWLAKSYPNGYTYSTNQPGYSELQMRYNLTAREYEITQLLFSGYDTIQIGEMLFISKNTVRKHIANIYNKLSVSNRYQLYNRAAQLLQQFEI